MRHDREPTPPRPDRRADVARPCAREKQVDLFGAPPIAEAGEWRHGERPGLEALIDGVDVDAEEPGEVAARVDAVRAADCSVVRAQRMLRLRRQRLARLVEALR